MVNTNTLEKYVMRSKNRRSVVLWLGGGSRSVSDLSSELGVPVQSVSRALRQLREKGLARCITPERKKSRVYELTERGERVFARLEKSTAHEEELDRKVSGKLSEVDVRYARNAKVQGGKFEVKPDFVIEGGQRLLVEVKTASGKLGLERVKGAALNFRDLKRAEKGIKTVLIIGGSSREGELGQEAVKLEDPECFDRVFFEDELREFIHFVKKELEWGDG